jgi:hypothetical protein
MKISTEIRLRRERGREGRMEEGQKTGRTEQTSRRKEGRKDGRMERNKRTTKLSKAVTFLLTHYKTVSHTETSSMYSNGSNM